jgi:hypothetical protein
MTERIRMLIKKIRTRLKRYEDEFIATIHTLGGIMS